MKIPSIRTRQDMETAAELRAAGATWETIAAQLQRKLSLVARWAKLYAEEWECLLREAEERLSRHADNESRSVTRQLLRDNDPKVRLDAADALAQRRQQEKAAEPASDPQSRYNTLTSQLDELSDEELRRFTLELILEAQETGEIRIVNGRIEFAPVAESESRVESLSGDHHEQS
jgi:HEAT repeat protein